VELVITFFVMSIYSDIPRQPHGMLTSVFRKSHTPYQELADRKKREELSAPSLPSERHTSQRSPI
jgi:hypothetical protein